MRLLILNVFIATLLLGIALIILKEIFQIDLPATTAQIVFAAAVLYFCRYSILGILDNFLHLGRCLRGDFD